MKFSIDRIRGHTFVSNLISGESYVIDLGMNQGDFAAEIQAKYGCLVVGVEANPYLASRIVPAEKLRAFNYAVTASKGNNVTFYIDKKNSEMSSLVATSEESRPISVPSITLPELMDRCGIGVVDLLKIDIEGAEIDLLLSVSSEMLLRTKQVSVEFHAFMNKGSLSDIAKIRARLADLGFLEIDFSRTLEDVLFINTSTVRVTQKQRLSLLRQKYASGVARKMGRILNLAHAPRTS